MASTKEKVGERKVPNGITYIANVNRGKSMQDLPRILHCFLPSLSVLAGYFLTIITKGNLSQNFRFK